MAGASFTTTTTTLPRCIAASDQSLLVELGEEIAPAINARVRRLHQALVQARLPGIIDLHPGYASLLVRFDPLRVGRAALTRRIEDALVHLDQIELPPPRHLEIPVHYGGAAGPDLATVAALHELTVQKVMALHSQTRYQVYFLGFAPGFGYLGGLPPALWTPRLATPRPLVPAGSVGIAGRQTGVYPLATPGGWRLIGRTPRALLDARRPEMTLLQPGDEVTFVPLSVDEGEAANRG
jgi:inhibitor of KinA